MSVFTAIWILSAGLVGCLHVAASPSINATSSFVPLSPGTMTHIVLDPAGSSRATRTVRFTPSREGYLVLVAECLRGPESATLEPTPDALPPKNSSTGRTMGRLVHYRPGLEANVPLFFRLTNRSAEQNICSLVPYPVAEEDALRWAGLKTLTPGTWTPGMLFAAAGKVLETYRLELEGPADIGLACSSGEDACTLSLALISPDDTLLQEGTGAIEVSNLPAGSYQVEVRGGSSPYPIPFEILLKKETLSSNYHKECPVRSLGGGRWVGATLKWEGACDRVLQAEIGIYTRTQVTFHVKTADPGKVDCRYRAPEEAWYNIGAEYMVPEVDHFGPHRIEVVLKGPLEPGGSLDVAVRAELPRDCEEVALKVCDARQGGHLTLRCSPADYISSGATGKLMKQNQEVGRVRFIDKTSNKTMVVELESGSFDYSADPGEYTVVFTSCSN